MSSTSPYADPKDLKPGDFLQNSYGTLFFVEKIQKNGLFHLVECSTGYKTKVVDPSCFFLPSKKLVKKILSRKEKELRKQQAILNYYSIRAM